MVRVTVARRLLSSGGPNREVKMPRFAQTLKEASKPALAKSMTVDRPFGYDSPLLLNHRVTDHFTFGGLRDSLFSSEAKERRQKKLDHDIVHSPFYDSKSFENTNGKIFTPPVSYFRKDKALYFPGFVGDSLVKGDQSIYDVMEDKVNIVRVFSTMSGEKCVDTFFKVGSDNYLTTQHSTFTKTYPNSQIIDLNIPQNWIKGFLVKSFKNSLKKAIPPERHNSYFIVPESVFAYDVRMKLLCDNLCSGYIYLVDHNGRIRWCTSGYATDEELKLMWRCVRGLEKELHSLKT